MPKALSHTKGFSIVEAMLASGIFALIVTALVGALIYGKESTTFAGERERAVFLAEEGLEIVRNIREDSFDKLQDGAYGLAITANQWTFSGVQDVNGNFTRHIDIYSVDADTKLVSSTVEWTQNSQRPGQIILTTRLTNWQKPAPAPAPLPEVVP